MKKVKLSALGSATFKDAGIDTQKVKYGAIPTSANSRLVLISSLTSSTSSETFFVTLYRTETRPPGVYLVSCVRGTTESSSRWNVTKINNDPLTYDFYYKHEGGTLAIYVSIPTYTGVSKAVIHNISGVPTDPVVVFDDMGTLTPITVS